MLSYKQADSDLELRQILNLQQANLPRNLAAEEIKREGFVTAEHSFKLLKSMNEACKHTIVKGVVVGYALSMHPSFSNTIAVLKPMFDEINNLLPQSKNYIVMGQICIAKTYRGKGIFRGLYESMKKFIPNNFTKIITEVDAKNIRSLNAHKAVGFIELKRYWAGDKEWYLVVL
jgi:hypothetical protein